MGKSYIHDVNLTYMQGINYQKKKKEENRREEGRKEGGIRHIKLKTGKNSPCQWIHEGKRKVRRIKGGFGGAGHVPFLALGVDYTGMFNKIIHSSIYTYDLQTLPYVIFQ